MVGSARKEQFSDIRGELRKRINMLEAVLADEQKTFAAAQEKALAEHRKRADAVKSALANYRTMLDLEESFSSVDLTDDIGPRQPSNQGGINITLPEGRLPLADFFIVTLRERGPMTKEALKAAAERAGYFGLQEGGGRKTHATLENIKRSGRIHMNESGEFVAGEMEQALL